MVGFVRRNIVWLAIAAVYIYLLANAGSAVASNYYLAALEMVMFVGLSQRIGYGNGKTTRACQFGLVMLIVVVYIVQAFALYLSESYVGSLALQNVNQGESVLTPNALILALALILISGIYQFKTVFLTLDTAGEIKPKQRYFVLLFVFYFVIFVRHVGSGNEGSLSKYDSPLLGFAKSVSVVAKEYNLSCISPALVNQAEINNKYVYSVDPIRNNINLDRPNVIVLFIEGMSKRNIESASYPDLMGRLNKFANENMSVERYYNHTAPTFRGLLGQMSSKYIELDGHGAHGWANDPLAAEKLAEQKKHSVVDLMKSKGYQTLFIEPHEKSYPLSLALKTLSFDRVITLDDARADLGHSACITSGGLSDRDQFLELKHTLEHLNKESPFFVGMYNNGTHAFIDVNECGVKYRDGKNAALNRFHNFDVQFGRFLDYFYKSGLHRNTILIVTADHASYPEPPYKDAFQSEFGDLRFVSEVPFYIYSPIHELPAKLDVAGANSLSFAPTLSALLGLKDYENRFWGKSVFDLDARKSLYVTSLGSDFYATTAEGVLRENELPDHYKDSYKSLTSQIKKSFKADRVCGVRY